jgi:ABC-type xylose transport system permease subunit
MANNTSQHILNTSASLLGFCLFVITSLHLNNKVASSVIDEFTSVIAILLAFSCFFSFTSIRTRNQKREKRLETIADYLFVAALIGILIVIVLITFNFID